MPNNSNNHTRLTGMKLHGVRQPAVGAKRRPHSIEEARAKAAAAEAKAEAKNTVYPTSPSIEINLMSAEEIANTPAYDGLIRSPEPSLELTLDDYDEEEFEPEPLPGPEGVKMPVPEFIHIDLNDEMFQPEPEKDELAELNALVSSLPKAAGPALDLTGVDLPTLGDLAAIAQCAPGSETISLPSLASLKAVPVELVGELRAAAVALAEDDESAPGSPLEHYHRDVVAARVSGEADVVADAAANADSAPGAHAAADGAGPADADPATDVAPTADASVQAASPEQAEADPSSGSADAVEPDSDVGEGETETAAEPEPKPSPDTAPEPDLEPSESADLADAIAAASAAMAAAAAARVATSAPTAESAPMVPESSEAKDLAAEIADALKANPMKPKDAPLPAEMREQLEAGAHVEESAQAAQAPIPSLDYIAAMASAKEPEAAPHDVDLTAIGIDASVPPEPAPAPLIPPAKGTPTVTAPPRKLDMPTQKPYRFSILSIFAIVIIALLIEVFAFNLPSVTTAMLGNGTVAQETSRGYNSEYDTYEIAFSDVNAPLDSIRIMPKDGESLKGSIYLSDEGHRYLINYGGFDVSSDNLHGQYIPVHSAGSVSRITLDIPAGEEAAEAFESLVLNPSIPLSIDPQRLAIILVALALIWYLRPRSGAFFIQYRPRLRTSIIIWVCLGLLTGAAFAAYTLNFIAISADFDAEANNQYFELAQALASQSLALLQPPPPGLDVMMNPYDPFDRIAKQIPALWDHAYYDGRYYVYFGILPALIFHFPCYMLTGQPFPNHIAVLVMFLVLNAAVIHLVNNMVRRWFPNASIGAAIMAILILLFGSWALFCLKAANIYTLPIITALTCAVFALSFWIKATLGKKAPIEVPKGAGARSATMHAGATASAQPNAANPKLNLAAACWGSFFCGLTLASRPQFFIVAILGLILFIGALRNKQGRGAANLLVFLPLLAVAALVGLYNFARFGSPLDFGASYNLTSNDMTHRTFSALAVPQALYYYMIAPPQLEVAYPYVTAMPISEWMAARTTAEPMYGGILLTTPVLLTPLLVIGNRRMRTECRIICIASVVLAVAVASFDGLAAGILPRYLADFGIFLAIPAAMMQLYFSSDRKMAKPGSSPDQLCGWQRESDRAIQLGLNLLLVASAVFQLLYNITILGLGS